MLWRSKSGKDRDDKPKEQQVDAGASEDVKSPVEQSAAPDVREALKEKADPESDMLHKARQSVLMQAEKDAAEARRRAEEAKEKELREKKELAMLREKQQKAEAVRAMAERKRREAIEAERYANEVSRKKALEIMEKERRAKVSAEKVTAKEQPKATADEIADFFDERRPAPGLDDLKETLKDQQDRQERIFGKISEKTGSQTDRLSQTQKIKAEELAEAHRKIELEQQQRIRIQQEKMEREKRRAEDIMIEKQKEIERLEEEKGEALLKAEEVIRAKKAADREKLAKDPAYMEKRRAAEEAKARKAEARRLAAEKKKEEQRLAQEAEARKKAEKAARAEEKRIAREKKAEIKAAEKRHKIEEKEKIRDEKRRAAEEKARLIEERKAEAKKGGGLVNVKGLKISTEVNKKPVFLWHDVLGLKSRKEKKAATEEEREELRLQREKKKEQAREGAKMLTIQRKISYENSRIGKRIRAVQEYCEHHKKMLFVGLAAVIFCVTGVAGVFNYYTAYTYSYNGAELGIVKEKDDVLKMVDTVQTALTEDKDMDIQMDSRDDITFERIFISGDMKVDTSQDVLKRLTYMGNLNVKASGIYVNGKKIGAVADDKAAKNVLQSIKDRYANVKEGGTVNKDESEYYFIEDVEVKESDTDLESLYSEDEMLDIMCESGKKEIEHVVKAGETLNSVAQLYEMTEDEIIEDNPTIKPNKLELGSVIKINQNAPIVRVKAVERVTYDQTVEHEVEKVETKKLYKGDKKIRQKGKDGVNVVTSTIVSVNGKPQEEKNVEKAVKTKAVGEIILVGTKKRPPTIGSGEYAWPLKSGYRISSPFGPRWGRLHAGVDLACNIGTNILAADGGTVTKAGYNGSYGKLVVIDHKNGQETRYAHCSKLLVNVGDKVYKGQHIAEVGNTGRSTGPHLHFEVRIGGVPKNPLNYLP